MKLLALFPATFLLFPAHAATVNLLPVADGHIADGGILGLSVNSTDTRVSTLSSGRDTRGIVEFDLSTIPSAATITSVDFIVTQGSTFSNTASTALIEFYSFAGDGSITVADFASPGTLQRSENFVLPSPIGTTFILSMSDLAPFQAVAGTNNEIGIRADTVNFVTFRFYSTESGVSSEQMPNLRVTYVPEPSSGLYLLISAAFLTRRNRR